MSKEFIQTNPTTFLPDGLNVESYQEAVATFGPALLVSFQNVLLVLVIKLLALILGGYGLANVNKYLRKILFVFFLLISVIPEISIYINLLKIRNETGINHSVIMSLTMTHLFSFFSLTYFYNTFMQVGAKNKKLFQIDNLKLWERFYYGYWPSLKMPVFLTVIFTTIEVWNSFLWPSIILSGKDINTVATWFPALGPAINGGNYLNVVSAGAVLSLIIPLGVYLINSRLVNRNLYRAV
ncbi:ABC transporter permease subunit [Candidatus Mycoplasma pogonae]